jgi:hypothetical protein
VRELRCFAAVAALGLLSAPAFPAGPPPAAKAEAVDLAKVDRRIRKEPAYQGKAKYCLLAFGPEARARRWLVLDGAVVYFDRNGNLDLTDEEDRVAGPGAPFKPVDVPGGTGKARYRVSELSTLARKDGTVLTVAVSTPGKYRQFGDALLSDRPQTAPVLHFDGPLAMFLAPGERRRPLVPGARPGAVLNQLRASVGTLSSDTAGVFVDVEHDPGVPPGTHPGADVEFPVQGKGGRVTTIQVTLDKRC